MKTLFAGVGYFIIGMLGIGLVLSGSIIGLYLLTLVIVAGFIPFFIIWFGNDMSWIFSKIKMNKTGAKGIILNETKDHKTQLLFINPLSKEVKIPVMTTQGKMFEPIAIDEPYSSLEGTNISIWYHKHGTHKTSIPGEAITMENESVYIGDIVKEHEDIGKLMAEKSEGNQNFIMLVLIGLTLIGTLFVGYNSFQSTTTLQGINEGVIALNGRFNPSDINAVVVPPKQSSSLIPGVI